MLMNHTMWPTTTMMTMPTWCPSTFWFDSFDELDLLTLESTMPSMVQWLNKPEWLTTMTTCPMTTMPLTKKVLQKYRVIVDISGFTTPLTSLHVELKPNNKLFVWGKEEMKESEESLWFKELKKCFDLPTNIEPEKLVSFIMGHFLIVEVPLKDAMPLYCMKELMPVWTTDKKDLTVTITLPPGLTCPTKLDIIVKDRDICIKYMDTAMTMPQNTMTCWWTAWVYKKLCTLPENTKWDELKFELTGGNMLKITVPLVDMEMWNTTMHTTTMMPTLVDWTTTWKTMWPTTMPTTTPMTKCPIDPKLWKMMPPTMMPHMMWKMPMMLPKLF